MTLLEFSALTLVSAELEAREALNAVISVTSFNICLLLLFYLYREWRLVGGAWWKEEGIPVVILQLGLFGVIGWRSLVTWITLKLATDGIAIAGLAETVLTWSLIFSGIVLVGFTLRATYLYAPAPWCHRTWIISAASAILVLLLTI